MNVRQQALNQLSSKALKDREVSHKLLTFVKNKVKKEWWKKFDSNSIAAFSHFANDEKSDKADLRHLNAHHKEVLAATIQDSEELLSKIEAEEDVHQAYVEFCKNKSINLWKVEEILKDKTHYIVDDLSSYRIEQDQVIRPILNKLIREKGLNDSKLTKELGISKGMVTEYLSMRVKKNGFAWIPEYSLGTLFQILKTRGWKESYDKEQAEHYKNLEKYLIDNPELANKKKRKTTQNQKNPKKTMKLDSKFIPTSQNSIYLDPLPLFSVTSTDSESSIIPIEQSDISSLSSENTFQTLPNSIYLSPYPLFGAISTPLPKSSNAPIEQSNVSQLSSENTFQTLPSDKTSLTPLGKIYLD